MVRYLFAAGGTTISDISVAEEVGMGGISVRATMTALPLLHEDLRKFSPPAHSKFSPPAHSEQVTVIPTYAIISMSRMLCRLRHRGFHHWRQFTFEQTLF